ncbi:Uncharacterized protein SCF082_LOCUS4271 [Durusdinium trenchii]|uniref:Uncharacterized protein n=1 Tax=Durusdinium trenchii TaxID=1381693 RepID=A0ABP0HYF9_9DINO
MSPIPETQYYEATATAKKATSRAREVMKDAADAHKQVTEYKRRPDTMLCLEEVLFFCRGQVETQANQCKCNSLYFSSTIPDADILAPLGEDEREDITAEISFSTPFAPESEGWTPLDRMAGRRRRLREMKDLVLGGGSTGFAAMDRILEGLGKRPGFRRILKTMVACPMPIWRAKSDAKTQQHFVTTATQLHDLANGIAKHGLWGESPEPAAARALALRSFPPSEKRMEVKWEVLPETSSFLETLIFSEEGMQLVPGEDVQCVGLDVDSGLLLCVRLEMEAASKGTGRHTATVDTGPEHLFAENDLQARQLATKGGVGGYGESAGRREKDSKGKGSCKGSPSHSKGKCKESSVLVLPPSSAAEPFIVPLSVGHPLKYAVELQAVLASQSFPTPSLGLAVGLCATVPEDLMENLRLVAFEVAAGCMKWRSLSVPGSSCETFCLDRHTLRAISVQLKGGHRWVVFQKLRGFQSAADSILEEFPLTSLGASQRATSIAWCTTRDAVLITFVGSHAIHVYQKEKTGPWTEATLGDLEKRGCVDGPADQLRFWFPSSAQSESVAETSPLLPGPNGEVYVHSGGALMLLHGDLSAARKVSSMREELWMTEQDEGTPEFPISFHCLGVHEGKAYRTLLRSDWTCEVLLRRLQVSSVLRAPRSQIRAQAPQLWPKITERRIFAADDAPVACCMTSSHWLAPDHYNEADRDDWDGKCSWLPDAHLWSKVPKAQRPQELRACHGALRTFEEFMRDFKYDDHYSCRSEIERAIEELIERRASLPEEITHECHPHRLKSFSVDRWMGYMCALCGNHGFFDHLEDWGYGHNEFKVHPYCVLAEEKETRQQLVDRWTAQGREAYESECPVVLDFSG